MKGSKYIILSIQGGCRDSKDSGEIIINKTYDKFNICISTSFPLCLLEVFSQNLELLVILNERISKRG